MAIEIQAIGGYGEVGKNMTAIKVDDTVIICDMGLHLENYISYTNDEDLINIDPDEMIKHKAIPNIDLIKEWHEKVKAIVPSHGHLDHVGAIPFIGSRFNAPVICTPFTSAVLKKLSKDAKVSKINKIKELNVNSSIKIDDNVTIEFISITHSTPQTVMIVLHTKYGKLVYANDFKFDKYPVLGTKPNFKRLKQLGDSGKVVGLIMDSLYSHEQIKTPSESVAKEMLRDVLLGTNSEGKAIVISTFSSHLARLKSIIKFGKMTGRKIVIIGRSLHKYITAGEEVGIINFSNEVEITKYSSKAKTRFNKIIKEGKDKYLIVVTGHQGEPQSMLSKMADGLFDFKAGDHVIFSSNIIPTHTTRKNRATLEEKLKSKGVRIFKDIHVSGHPGREDLRDLLEILKPKNIIPSHCEVPNSSQVVELGIDLGYKSNQVHILKNNSLLTIPGN